MNLEQARKQLMDLQAKISAYDHAMGLISYDGETTAPKGTADNRAQTLGIFSEISFMLATGEDGLTDAGTLFTLMFEVRDDLDEPALIEPTVAVCGVVGENSQDTDLAAQGLVAATTLTVERL